MCAKRENCPSPGDLVDIGTIYEKRIERSRELFEKLVCSPKYHFVYTGTFEQQNNTKHGLKLLRFKVDIPLKGSESYD